MVTVVTPTWNRHRLLFDRCIPSVAHQDYHGRWEHIVVSDGPDPELAMVMRGRPSIVRYHEMLDHDPNVLWGNRARIKGQELAVGEIIAHIDDDNAWRSNHLTLLVVKLLDSEADFVYSRMLRHPAEDVVGWPPPRYSQIDTSIIVHRRELLNRANWMPHHERRDPDWELVEAWMAAGARWAYVPEITCDYYTNQ